MSIPSYPGGPPPDLSPGARPDQPATIRQAVLLMYVGAALAVINVIIAVAEKNKIKTALRNAAPNDSASTINTAYHTVIAGAVIGASIGVALWVWMAIKNGQGRKWARVLSSVFYGIATLDFIVGVVRTSTGLLKAYSVLTWVVATVIIVLLWRSTAFYQQAEAARIPGAPPFPPGAGFPPSYPPSYPPPSYPPGGGYPPPGGGYPPPGSGYPPPGGGYPPPYPPGSGYPSPPPNPPYPPGPGSS